MQPGTWVTLWTKYMGNTSRTLGDVDRRSESPRVTVVKITQENGAKPDLAAALIDPFDTHPKTSQSVCNKPPTATPFDLSIPIDSANFMSSRITRIGHPPIIAHDRRTV